MIKRLIFIFFLLNYLIVNEGFAQRTIRAGGEGMGSVMNSGGGSGAQNSEEMQ